MFRSTGTWTPQAFPSLTSPAPIRGRRSVRTRACTLLAPALLALALVACSSSADEESSATTTTTRRATTSTSTTTVDSTSGTTASGRWTAEQQEVIDAYLAAMAAYDSALSDPPNPDHPDLLATTVDPVLTEVRNLAASWRGFGQALRYPPGSVHRIETLQVDIDGDEATIETCNVDDGIVYEPATGNVLNDEVSTARDRATMIRANGVWRLSTRVQLQEWEGVAGCAGTSSS